MMQPETESRVASTAVRQAGTLRATDDVVIEVAGLRKTYGDLVALGDASFSVRRGEIFGLLGPNGAGKTTAVECIQGLRSYDAGTVRVIGLDPHSQAEELRLHIGCQLQQSALPDNIRVWEALDMFASLCDGPADWKEASGTRLQEG